MTVTVYVTTCFVFILFLRYTGQYRAVAIEFIQEILNNFFISDYKFYFSNTHVHI